MQSGIVSRAKTTRIFRLTGWLLFIALLPVMLLSLDMVIQSARSPDRLPVIFGYKALILLPDRPGAERDLGIIRTVDPAGLKERDQIAYKEGNAYFIEPVSQVDAAVNGLALLTSSGSGNDPERTSVSGTQVEGQLVSRIPKVGSWALYLQTPAGMLIFLALPCLLFFLLDTFRHGRPAEPVLLNPNVRVFGGSNPGHAAAAAIKATTNNGFERGSVRPSET